MNITKLILAILQLVVPVGVQVVEGLSEKSSDPISGADKRQAVQGLAQGIAAGAGATPEQAASISDLAGAAVDTTVSVFNAVGKFQKSAGAATQP